MVCLWAQQDEKSLHNKRGSAKTPDPAPGAVGPFGLAAMTCSCFPSNPLSAQCFWLLLVISVCALNSFLHPGIMLLYCIVGLIILHRSLTLKVGKTAALTEFISELSIRQRSQFPAWCLLQGPVQTHLRHFLVPVCLLGKICTWNS